VIEVAAKMGYATMASPALAGAALIGAAIMDRGMKITPYRSQ
jgi:hypothetical protein